MKKIELTQGYTYAGGKSATRRILVNVDYIGYVMEPSVQNKESGDGVTIYAKDSEDVGMRVRESYEKIVKLIEKSHDEHFLEKERLLHLEQDVNGQQKDMMVLNNNIGEAKMAIAELEKGNLK